MSNMHNPAHPGEVLREYLPEGVSVGKAAKRLGVTRQALSALLNGRAGVSASMALRLEGALGPAPRCGSTCRRAATSGELANAHRESSEFPHQIGCPEGVTARRPNAPRPSRCQVQRAARPAAGSLAARRASCKRCTCRRFH